MTMYCLIVYSAAFTTVRNLHGIPQYPTKTTISHEESDSTDVASSFKVSKASRRVYRRTPAMRLNSNQRCQRLVQQSYEPHPEQV